MNLKSSHPEKVFSVHKCGDVVMLTNCGDCGKRYKYQIIVLDAEADTM